MTEEERPLGMGLREAKQELIRLTTRMKQVSQELHAMRKNSKILFPTETPDYKKLSKEYDDLAKETDEVREWYNIGLSERLYDESKRLNELTVVLIVWTVVLSATTIADFILRFIR
jgi:hypothetical protein